MEGLRLINTSLADTIAKVNSKTDDQIEEFLSQPLEETFDEIEKFIQEAREMAGEMLKELTFGDFLEGIDFGAYETEDPAE